MQSVGTVFSIPAAFTLLLLPPRLPFPVQPNLVCLGSVVHERFPEPWMLQGLFGRDTFLGVVHEDLPQEIKELAIEVGMPGDGFLTSLDLLENQMQRRTGSFFIAFTYFLDALFVSVLG